MEEAARQLDPASEFERVARRFTGRSGAEIIATRRVDCSVVFADIVSFRRVAQVITPADVMRLSRGFFEAAVPLLVKHRVQPMNYLGDALLAVAAAGGSRVA